MSDILFALAIVFWPVVFLLGTPLIIGWLIPWIIPHWIMVLFYVYCGVVVGIAGCWALFAAAMADSQR